MLDRLYLLMGVVMKEVSRFSGSVSTPKEVDSFEVDLVSGKHYSFDVTGQTALNSSYTLGNPVLKIFAPDGSLIAEQDYSTWSGNGEAGLIALDPHFGFTAGLTGRYTVSVSSAKVADLAKDWDAYLPNSGQTVDNINSTGSYLLSINEYSNQELVDPVIGNYRWMDHSGDARGAGATIYYDYSTNNLGSSTSTATNPVYGWNNIKPFSTADQQKIEGWLKEFEAVANVKFVKADGSHPASMHFMLGQAIDGSTGTAWLYDKQGYQFNAGDYTADKQIGRVDLLVDVDTWAIDGFQSSAYSVFMHEVGHALGLKHPGNYSEWGVSQRVENVAFDNDMWSQMSYSSNYQAVSPSEGNALKALDIAALQAIYGKNAITNASDNLWSFNDTHAEYQTTIYDTGGIDTLDASGQMIGSLINLQPGSLSSIGGVVAPDGMAAQLEHYKLPGVFGDKAYNNIGLSLDTLIENAKGGSGNDFVFGNELNNNISVNSGNDTVVGNGGDDQVDGGQGVDTAVYRGNSSDYKINLGANNQASVVDRISDRDGSDTLVNVERLHFSDTEVAIDINGNAGSAYRLYKAAFDRIPDEGGLGFWIDYLDDGGKLSDAASYFTISPEFQSLYGSQTTDNQFVDLLYKHVLHREAEGEGYNFWVNALSPNGGWSRGGVLEFFSQSLENQGQTAELVANGIHYQEWLG